MSHLLIQRLLLLSISAIAVPLVAQGEEVRTGMDSLLTPFRKIQPYIASQDKFTKPENSKEVLSIIQDLRTNFHKLESIPSSYHSLPGFDENVLAVTELLDDSSRRFSEGKTSYSWWRLKKLPSDCFTCHATYKVTNHYSNDAVIDSSLDPLNKARFLLATRQFSEAQAEFLKVLRDPQYRLNYDEALRSILLIATRIDSSPSEGVSTLKTAVEVAKLPEDDAREVAEWLRELTAWANEKPSSASDSVAFAEQLITGGVVSLPSRPQSDVSLLRGTAILHKKLERGELKKESRPQALYLLGLAYTKLPLFFSESWAEMYLERCIKEYPGSMNAKRSFAVYREHVVDDYSGITGTEIPAEVQLHLEELRKKAYGEPNFRDVAMVRGKEST